jgi:hypothetical protein
VIVRAAVVPHPPLLVPELVAGTDPDVSAVRDACLAAATALAGVADRWVAVGADAAVQVSAPLGPDAAGTFAGFGVDVVVRLDAASMAEPDPAMPLPALVAGWLRERVDANQVTMWVVPPDLAVDDCRALGRRLAEEHDGPDPVGLLILGDGSPRHGERAPGRPDDRADAFDDQVRTALATADPAALLALDAGLATELDAVGRAPWQVLAGTIGAGWTCVNSDLLIPFGVAYHVAVLEPGT